MAYKNPIKDFNLRSSPEFSTGYFGKFWNGKVEQNMYNGHLSLTNTTIVNGKLAVLETLD